MLQPSSYYDEVYRTGGAGGAYGLPFGQSAYVKIWTEVLLQLFRHGTPKHVLEFGCGNGILAEKILEMGAERYTGVDFSAVGIEQARQRCGKNKAATFVCSDLSRFIPWGQPTHVVAVEVLEHILFDVSLLQSIQFGSRVVLSVPNFPAKSHVRTYPTEQFIRDRFQSLLDITDIVTRQRTFDVGTDRKVFVVTGIRR